MSNIHINKLLSNLTSNINMAERCLNMPYNITQNNINRTLNKFILIVNDFVLIKEQNDSHIFSDVIPFNEYLFSINDCIENVVYAIFMFLGISADVGHRMYYSELYHNDELEGYALHISLDRHDIRIRNIFDMERLPLNYLWIHINSLNYKKFSVENRKLIPNLNYLRSGNLSPRPFGKTSIQILNDLLIDTTKNNSISEIEIQLNEIKSTMNIDQIILDNIENIIDRHKMILLFIMDFINTFNYRALKNSTLKQQIKTIREDLSNLFV
jgi:hypothetical protein